MITLSELRTKKRQKKMQLSDPLEGFVKFVNSASEVGWFLSSSSEVMIASPYFSVLLLFHILTQHEHRKVTVVTLPSQELLYFWGEELQTFKKHGKVKHLEAFLTGARMEFRQVPPDVELPQVFLMEKERGLWHLAGGDFLIGREYGFHVFSVKTGSPVLLTFLENYTRAFLSSEKVAPSAVLGWIKEAERVYRKTTIQKGRALSKRRKKDRQEEYPFPLFSDFYEQNGSPLLLRLIKAFSFPINGKEKV